LILTVASVPECSMFATAMVVFWNISIVRHLSNHSDAPSPVKPLFACSSWLWRIPQNSLNQYTVEYRWSKNDDHAVIV